MDLIHEVCFLRQGIFLLIYKFEKGIVRLTNTIIVNVFEHNFSLNLSLAQSRYFYICQILRVNICPVPMK